MNNSIWVTDQTRTGIRLNQVRLSFDRSVITIQQLLEQRMQHEFAKCSDDPNIEPLPYFTSSGFFITVGDRRVDDLSEEVILHRDQKVSFVENLELDDVFCWN